MDASTPEGFWHAEERRRRGEGEPLTALEQESL
jgi:hypothetical protein